MGRSIIIACLCGVWATLVLPPKLFAGTEGNLLAFSGIVIAAVIPTMALMATVLRAGKRSISELRLLGNALIAQFDFWVGVLVIAIGISIVLVCGSLLKWHTVPFVSEWVGGVRYVFDPIQILNGLIVAGMVLMAFKVRPFIEGFRSLLELHVEQVVDEAQAAFDTETAGTTEAIKSKPSDPAFGAMVKH